MKKLLLWVPLLALLIVSCKKEEEDPVAEAVRITSIEVQNYPLLDEDGNAWDDPALGSSTPPDVYYVIVESGGNETISDTYFDDADADALLFDNSSGLPVLIDNPTATLTIQFWDLDDLDASDVGSSDDLMVAISFKPYAEGDDMDVTSLIVEAGGVTLVVGVEFI